jgi:hypothetical protein
MPTSARGSGSQQQLRGRAVCERTCFWLAQGGAVVRGGGERSGCARRAGGRALGTRWDGRGHEADISATGCSHGAHPEAVVIKEGGACEEPYVAIQD